jgi:hypothetical protein
MEEEKQDSTAPGSKTGKSPLRLLVQGGAWVAGWFLTHLSYRRMVRQEVDQLRSEMREQLRRLAELEMALSRMAGKTTAEPLKPAAAPLAPEAAGEIEPERLAVLAAVVTAFLGRKVKIHQARLLVNPEVVSAWAQQGRVFVQASHALTRH